MSPNVIAAFNVHSIAIEIMSNRKNLSSRCPLIFYFLQKSTLIFIEIVIVSSVVFADSRKMLNPLAGKNLVIIPLSAPIEFRFNDSDKLQEHMPRSYKTEVEILKWLLRRYDFTFSVLTTNETTLEKPLSIENRGSLSYLLDGTCDLLLGTIVMTQARCRLVDMPFPWIQNPVHFLIPVSDSRANFSAIFKPFQFPVWILFILSILVVIVALESYLLFLQTYIVRSKQKCDQRRAFTTPVYLYVTGVALSQGGHCLTKRRTVRLVVGAWCLACFVLVQAYTCTLIPYVITPNNQPLINSIYDIGRNPNIRLLVEKNMGIDTLFSGVSEDNGIFRTIRDRINHFPESRCVFEADCIDKVGSGGPYVFIQGKSFLLNIMLIDFKKTRTCRLQIAKEGFANVLISFALPKGSFYVNLFSKGMMELNSFGLTNYWTKLNQANPHQCLPQSNRHYKKTANPRLSLKNLTGAYIVLVFGYLISFSFFVCEKVYFIRQNPRNKLIILRNQ